MNFLRTRKPQLESLFKMAAYRWLQCQPSTFVWINRTTGIPLGNGKFRPNDQAGISDITGLKNGKFFAFELKVGSGKLTGRQKNFGERIEQCGGYFFVAKDMEELEEKFKTIH